MSAPIWFDSTETGAPIINNANGAVVAALRAILVNGFNVKAISSISVASGVATVTCPGHAFSSAYGKWIKISGASAPALDGVKKQTIVDANTFTYPAAGVADGSYTATDARRAPLGWVETYANGGGTKAIFARSVPEANDIDLRVDDTGTAPATTSGARFIMVKGATGVDAYTSQAPTEAQVPGGLVCTKVANTATAKQWLAIGTDRDFFLFVGDAGAARYMPALCFFDGVAYRVGDVNFTVAAGTSGSSVSSVGNHLFANNSLTIAPSLPERGVVFSDEVGIGAPEPLSVVSQFKSGDGHGSASSGVPTDPLDFAIAFDPYLRATKAGVRGTVPGNGEPFINANSAPAGVFLVQDLDDGAKVLLVKIAYASANAGMTAFRLSQEWR